jgi:hypothetical protein
MDADVMKIPVKIFLPNNDIIQGKMLLTKDGPRLFNLERTIEDTSANGIEFSIIDDTQRKSISISPEDRIEFASCTFIKKINLNSTGQYDLYPPSTDNWVTLLSNEGINATIALQRFKKGSRYLLSIIDSSTGELIRLHPINSYECSILQMVTDWDLYNQLFVKRDLKSKDVQIADLLEKPAPSWSDIGKLLEGVSIPNLQRRKTLGETFDQLIPKSFPEDIRKELMVFLAWTTEVKVPDEDPLDFLDRINNTFPSGVVLSNLVFGHIQCLIDGITPPSYVRIMVLAHQGAPKFGLTPTVEEVEMTLWADTWHRLSQLFPDSKGRVISIAHSLNTKQEIHANIPITRNDAKKSKKAWLDRFALIRSNLIMRGYIQDAKLGLSKLVYIGGAHRWPHKHLQYTARLGNPSQKPPYIQVLVMPRTAVDRIMRAKQNIAPIDWTASRLNYGLYLPKLETWKNNTIHVEGALSRKKTRRQLDKEFNLTGSGEIVILSRDDARVLDLISWGLYNQSMESGEYGNIVPLDAKRLEEKIDSFIQRGVVYLQYFPTIYGLASICLEIKGEVPQLYSIARSTLLHFPSATTMVSESNNLCVVMARVPEERAYDILVNLPSKAREYNIQMKGYRVSAYAGYVNNLYQRLLLPDGSWDDDISGFLSQIRS